MFSDIDHITYGYSDKAKHQVTPIGNSINGLELSYQGVSIKTNLIIGFHIRNLACALAILSELEALDINTFKEFAKNILIRGRYEKIKVNNKNIILDTGYSGAGSVLYAIEHALGNSKYRVIFSSVHYQDVSKWVINSRRNNGMILKRANFIYLTNPTNSSDEKDIFINDVMEQGFNDYKYIPNLEEACEVALNELQDDETLIIFTRDFYRRYRRCFEQIAKSR